MKRWCGAVLMTKPAGAVQRTTVMRNRPEPSSRDTQYDSGAVAMSRPDDMACCYGVKASILPAVFYD